MKSAGSEALAVPATPAHLEYLTDPAWAFPAWVQHLNERLTTFLMKPGQGFMAVEAPVRHGKSRLCSTTAPAWFLGMNPTKRVLLASNSDSLSTDLSRGARDILVHHGKRLFGVEVRQDARAASNWRLAQGGGMRAVSRNGAIIGTGGDLIILDDPVKDVFEASKRNERDKIFDWYQGVLRTRLEGDGKVLLIMSRWHQDDLIGRLLDTPAYAGDPWERVHLPAIAEPAVWELDSEGNLETGETMDEWRDEMGRQIGEPLWPERWPIKVLDKVKALPVWSAQYQQRPLSPGGDMFPRKSWVAVDEAPKSLNVICRIDLAASQRATGDWCAMATLGRDSHGQTYVLDVRRIRGQQHIIEEWVGNSADEIADLYPGLHFIVEQEPGSGGLMMAENFVRDVLARHSAEKRPTVADKVINAQPFAAQVQAGNVMILRHYDKSAKQYVAAKWWVDFLDESSEFPKGAHDDQIDAASQAYNDLVRVKRLNRKGKISASASRRSLAGSRVSVR